VLVDAAVAVVVDAVADLDAAHAAGLADHLLRGGVADQRAVAAVLRLAAGAQARQVVGLPVAVVVEGVADLALRAPAADALERAARALHAAGGAHAGAALARGAAGGARAGEV